MVVQMLRTAVTLKWSEHKSKRSKKKKNLFGCARLILLCWKMFVFLSLTTANCSTNSKCLDPPPSHTHQRPTAASPLQTPSTNKQPQLDEMKCVPFDLLGFYATNKNSQYTPASLQLLTDFFFAKCVFIHTYFCVL